MLFRGPELSERTGLVSGDVPPFGEPVLPFPLYADESVFENPRIAFNAGSLTDSIITIGRASLPTAVRRRRTVLSPHCGEMRPSIHHSTVPMIFISTSSPIGRAIVGKNEGDEIQVTTPNGIRNFEITKLITIHDEA